MPAADLIVRYAAHARRQGRNGAFLIPRHQGEKMLGDERRADGIDREGTCGIGAVQLPQGLFRLHGPVVKKPRGDDHEMNRPLDARGRCGNACLVLKIDVATGKAWVVACNRCARQPVNMACLRAGEEKIAHGAAYAARRANHRGLKALPETVETCKMLIHETAPPLHERANAGEARVKA